jgi:hypothetical protein
MPKVTDELMNRIRAEVNREFPGDEMMQDIHLARQIHYYETKDLSLEEKIRYYGGSNSKKV